MGSSSSKVLFDAEKFGTQSSSEEFLEENKDLDKVEVNSNLKSNESRAILSDSSKKNL